MQSCRFQHTFLHQLHVTWVVLLDFFPYSWWLVQIAASSMSRFFFFFSFPKHSKNILQDSSQVIFKSAISNSCSCFNFWSHPQVSFMFLSSLAELWRELLMFVQKSHRFSAKQDFSVGISIVSILSHLLATWTGFGWIQPMVPIEYIFYFTVCSKLFPLPCHSNWVKMSS